VLRSGWLTSGPVVTRFENKVRACTKSRYAVAMNSCTAALHTIMLALGLKKGDEVLVPANTFVATANSVLYTGARPVLVDSDPSTYNISIPDLERKVTKRTKAVVPVHLGGNPCKMDEIKKLADTNGILVIEDAAHALGGEYRGRSCGTLGVAGAYSFYPTKVVTSGEGGMIVTDNKRIAERARVFRNQGRDGYGPRENSELGYNYRMPDILAAVGLVQIGHLRNFVRHRNAIARLYEEELSGIDCVSPQEVLSGGKSTYYAYIVRLTKHSPMTRDSLRARLNERGIETSVMYHPVHLQPLYARSFGYKRGDLPVAEELGRSSIALPMRNDMSQDEVHRVANAMKDFLG
jgi:perosamine synthetase